MSKRAVKKMAACIVLFLFLLSAAYLGLAGYYRDGFSYGTWINGIYCTGKSVEEVNGELLAGCSYGGLELYDGKGASFHIGAEDIGFFFDFEEALQLYQDGQNPYRWVENLLEAEEKTLTPVISYDREKLETVLESVSFLAEGQPDSRRRVYIRKTAAGYELVNERAGVLNKQKAEEEVRQAVLHFEESLDLGEKNCYEDLPYTEPMKAELARWEKINAFQDCHIVYCFGEDLVPVDASVACDWIALEEDGSLAWDEDGNLRPDEKKIEAFADKLADEYDTVGKTRHFQATRGETVTVEGGIYGNKIDRRAEKEYLKQAFLDRVNEMHTPQYTQKGWAEGKNDIGDTYIEVDMSRQMLYYYKKGRLELETPIVTGNTGRRMGTPEGVNYVYEKQENRILRGPNYASHVNFWMPVKGSIGIHDAAWRSEYGGEIYQTNGSHGCINTPYEAMSRLYGMAQVGTPVVMFY